MTWKPATPPFFTTISRYEFDDTPDFVPPLHVQWRERAMERERKVLRREKEREREKKLVHEPPTLKLKRCGCCGLQHTAGYKKLDGGVNPCARKKCEECEK